MLPNTIAAVLIHAAHGPHAHAANSLLGVLLTEAFVGVIALTAYACRRRPEPARGRR